jgi:hypothetical protein
VRRTQHSTFFSLLFAGELKKKDENQEKKMSGDDYDDQKSQ